MNPADILKFITNSTWMVTQLLGEPVVEFGRHEYRVLVHENEKPGPILQVTVQVAIQEAFVYFSIASGNDDNVFSINKYTGKINLVKPLDFETKKRHELIVKAKLGDDVTEARVVVEILDANDNMPYFETHMYETQITEEDGTDLPRGVLTVKAADRDEGRFGILRYSLSQNDMRSSSHVDQYFSIVPETGEIMVLQSLDRDPPDGRDRWDLIVEATDGENTAEAKVVINVKDVNDNPPVFPLPTVHATMYENKEAGLHITTVKAVDKDDIKEAGNANLTYSIEQNAIEVQSGSVIFRINNKTGDIFTTLCCLDRETIKEYELQVVAIDGGGMKGTGTVVVEVLDRNDVAPVFVHDEWNLSVREEENKGATIATLQVLDGDAENDFRFRIVEQSGTGWDLFDLKFDTKDALVQIIAKQRMDFESVDSRNGYRFQIEVTDKGDDGWNEEKRIGRAWVNIHLLDINDNQPYFTETYQHKTLPENTALGTVIATFTCKDADGGGRVKAMYMIEGANETTNQFGIDARGIIRLTSELDYEQSHEYRITVIGIDNGEPPRTASATLSIDVTDVNDNPPHLISPSVLKVIEETSPSLIGQLQLSDRDNGTMGNGAPYSVKLDPSADTHIKTLFRISFDSTADSGRGIGQVSLLKSLDREERKELLIPIVTSDNGSPKLSSTICLTVSVLDVNDNPMRSASKRIRIFAADRVRKDIRIGRVFVDDPDDWNVSQKTYSWRRPHPLFLLNETSGELSLRPGFKPGGYYLQFNVNDMAHNQKNILANVSVLVQLVRRPLLTSATPLMLAVEPHDLIKDNFSNDKDVTSLLRVLVSYIRRLVSNIRNSLGTTIDVVSIEPVTFNGLPVTRVWLSYDGPINLHHFLTFHKSEMEDNMRISILSIGTEVCGTLLRNCPSGCWSRIEIKDSTTLIDAQSNSFVGPSLNLAHGCGCSAPARSSTITGLPLAHPVLENVNPVGCSEGSCLNGGQCIPTKDGHRCVCPQETHGSSCKILSRHFGSNSSDEENSIRDNASETSQESWAWVDQIPSCTDVHVSIEFLTKANDAVLLFSGDLPRNRLDRDNLHKRDVQKVGSEISQGGVERKTTRNSFSEEFHSNNLTTNIRRFFYDINFEKNHRPRRSLSALRHKNKNFRLYEEQKKIRSHKYRRKRNRSQRFSINRDIFWLELRSGKPNLILDLGSGPVVLYLNTSRTLSDGRWHRIDVIWKDRLTELIVDLCFGSSVDEATSATASSNTPPEAKSCRIAGILPPGHSKLNTNAPLQVGGIAYEGIQSSTSISPSLHGCVRNLRINKEIRDLGYSLLSSNSIPGCRIGGCENEMELCGTRGKCVNKIGNTECVCDQGWSGRNCDTPTVPATLNDGHSLQYRLSFAPFRFSTSIQFRVRTRSRSGHLISLFAESMKSYSTIHIVKGKICFIFKLEKYQKTSICLNKLAVNDGLWHNIKALRIGYILFLEMDGGDKFQYNETLILEPRGPFDVHRGKGLFLGTLPDIMNHSTIENQKGLDGCLDDVRLQNLPIHIQSANDSWAQVTSNHHVSSGCTSPPVCANVTCRKPTTCIDNWRSYYCGCEEGKHLNQNGDICIDVDECGWSPCLNSGFCTNLQPGYLCTCASGFGGSNCETFPTFEASTSLPFSSIIILFTSCLVLLALSGLAFAFRRKKKNKKKNHSQEASKQLEPDSSLTSVFHLTKNDSTSYQMEVAHSTDETSTFMELKEYGPDDLSIPRNVLSDVHAIHWSSAMGQQPQECIRGGNDHAYYPPFMEDCRVPSHSLPRKKCCIFTKCQCTNLDISSQSFSQ